jgi:hypothetical protein
LLTKSIYVSLHPPCNSIISNSKNKLLDME